MLKILWKRGKIAPQEQFLPLSTIFYYLLLDFYVKTGIRFSLRDKRLFEITEVEITRVDCILSKERICSVRNKFFPLRVRPCRKGDKNEGHRISAFEGVAIHLETVTVFRVITVVLNRVRKNRETRHYSYLKPQHSLLERSRRQSHNETA